MSSDWFWFSTTRMTVTVRTNKAGIIVESPPITRKFLGQPIGNLRGWLKKQPGFRESSY
jgi:hypothetical protein